MISLSAFKDLEKRLRMVEGLTAKIPVRAKPGGGGGGAGSGSGIRIVKVLPAIPTSGGPELVFWTSSDGGTGDDQIWSAAPGDTRWYPTTGKWTNKSGVVV